MSPGGRTAALHSALLLLLSVPVLFHGLDLYGTINWDEAVYHTIARHMAESGDWTRLQYLGKEHVYDTFTKAPLQHWARAGLIALLGDTYVAMRLLSAAFGAATALAVAALGRRLATPRAGLLAGVVTLTAFQLVFLHGARTGESEALVAFLFAMVAHGFLRAAGDGRSWLPHHAWMFLLANVKLPLVLPVVAAEAALLLAPTRRGHLKRWLLLAAGLAPVAFAWHIAQFWRLGAEGTDVLARMLGEASGEDPTGAPSGSVPENLGLYARVLAFGFAPYLPVALLAVLRLAAGAGGRPGEGRWLLAYPIAALLFFLGVSKAMPWYVVPLYPFLAVGVGLLLDDALAGRLPRAAVGALAAAVLVGVCLELSPSDVRAFREAAFRLRPEFGWRGGPWSAAAAALLLALPILPARLLGLGGSLPRLLASTAAVAVLLVAAGRTARMLTRLEWTSPAERQALALRDRTAHGAPVEFPVRLAGRDFRLARAFLADRFRLRRAPLGAPWVGVVVGLREEPLRPAGSSYPVPRPWRSDP